MTSDKIPDYQEPTIDNKASESYVVVQFHSWFNFYFPLFLGMMNDNEYGTKEKYQLLPVTCMEFLGNMMFERG